MKSFDLVPDDKKPECALALLQPGGGYYHGGELVECSDIAELKKWAAMGAQEQQPPVAEPAKKKTSYRSKGLPAEPAPHPGNAFEGSIIEKIKERLTLREAASMAGVELPDRDGIKFASPFRPDANPSCSVSGEVFTDWSSGETLDCIGLYAAGKGMSNPEAVKALGVELGIIPDRAGNRAPAPQAVRSIHRKIEKPTSRVELPTLAPYSRETGQRIADSRGIPLAGVEYANALGTLGIATVRGFECWLLFDSSLRCAPVRRIDGGLFYGTRKADCIGGSSKSWPIGLLPAIFDLKSQPALPVMLVEGEPDYLAACAIIAASGRDILPVCMAGCGAGIAADALPHFSGRKVSIIGHPEEKGGEAALKWGAQLKGAGAQVRIFQLKGGDCERRYRKPRNWPV